MQAANSKTAAVSKKKKTTAPSTTTSNQAPKRTSAQAAAAAPTRRAPATTSAKNQSVQIVNSNQEECKGSSAGQQHFWQVAPSINYTEQLLEKGYLFDENQKLVRLDGEPIGRLSAADFETLGDLIQGSIQQQMKETHGMEEIWIGSSQQGAPKCNIFVSNDFRTNTGQCLVLIQGTGPVRAGTWARGAIINKGLVMGSMLPMIEFAKAANMSVLILNPNMHKDPISDRPIEHCESMADHCKYVWRTHLAKSARLCAASNLAIVAHSAGGRCIAAIFKEFKRDFMAQVKCLVFTDAYYHAMFPGVPRNELAILKSIGIHYKAYKTAHKNVGVPFQTQNGAILEVSAGTSIHGETTGTSLQAILDFITSKLSALD